MPTATCMQEQGVGLGNRGSGREAADVGSEAISGHGSIVPNRTASDEGDWERAGRAYCRHRPGRCLRRVRGRRSVLLKRHVRRHTVGF